MPRRVRCRHRHTSFMRGNKLQRQEAAAARAVQRTPQEQLQRLDLRNGVGLGAVKERNRLNALIKQDSK